MKNAPTLAELHASARSLRAAGLSTIPVSGKRPALSSWAAYQNRLPTEAELDSWYLAPSASATGLGVVCGTASHGAYADAGLLLIDADRADWISPFEAKAGSALDGVHIRETGSGKRHYAILADAEIVGHNRPLARYRDPSNPTKVCSGLETRENHGYFVALGVHPETHGIYRPLKGTLEGMTKISVDQALTLLEIARSFNEVDETPATGNTQRESFEGKPSVVGLVIEKYNALYPLRDRLSAYGYHFTGPNRARRPGGKSASVVIREDGRGVVSVHYSSSDELYALKNNRGLPIHDSFDVERLLGHGGDFWKTVKTIAPDVGVRLYYDERHTAEAPVKIVADNDGFMFFEQPDSDIAVIVDTQEAASVLYDLGCSALLGPRVSGWKPQWLDLVSARPKRFVWFSEGKEVADRLGIETKALVVDSVFSVDELVLGRGATDMDIASLLLSARTPRARIGLKEIVKSRIR